MFPARLAPAAARPRAEGHRYTRHAPHLRLRRRAGRHRRRYSHEAMRRNAGAKHTRLRLLRGTPKARGRKAEGKNDQGPEGIYSAVSENLAREPVFYRLATLRAMSAICRFESNRRNLVENAGICAGADERRVALSLRECWAVFISE